MAGAGPTSSSDDHHHDPVTLLSNRLKKLSQTSFDCRLLPVPNKLRRTHDKAFLPKQVSIGPYYHQGKEFKAMEDHKLRYLQRFLERTQKKLEEYIEVVKKLEERTRHCYLDKIDLNKNEFIIMVLVDGAFIIELLFLNRFQEMEAENDVIFDKQKEWMITEVRRDLTLMENQLPFFVLENLFNFAFGSRLGVVPSLLELAYDFFGFAVNLKAERAMIVNFNVKHLLDALRSWHLPATRDAQGAELKKVEAIPGALQLRAAGVKFKMSESNCLFDIKFSEGILYIPCLKLFPATESFLRNITAFEQCYYKHDSCFIDYAEFLGNLVNVKADSKLLIKKGIINTGHWLGHDEILVKDDEKLAIEAVDLFNSFGKETRSCTRNISFCIVRQNLNDYYRSHWHGMKISMKRKSVSKKKL